MRAASVTIIGAGIGGLTAAIALDRAGMDVEVYEQAPAIEPVGAGLALWPNAIRVLDRLGIGAAIRARAVRFDAVCAPPTAGCCRTSRRSCCTTGTARRWVGMPRSYLQDALLNIFGADRVHLGKVTVGYRQDGSGVGVRFADGSAMLRTRWVPTAARAPARRSRTAQRSPTRSLLPTRRRDCSPTSGHAGDGSRGSPGPSRSWVDWAVCGNRGCVPRGTACSARCPTGSWLDSSMPSSTAEPRCHATCSSTAIVETRETYEPTGRACA